MGVQSSNLEAIVRQSTWRYDTNGQAIKDKNGNEIAFFNQNRQKSFFDQMERSFDATNHTGRELSTLIKDLKKKDISAYDMDRIMTAYINFVTDPNDTIPDPNDPNNTISKFDKLKNLLQEVKDTDYSTVEVKDLATSALEDKDKTNHLPQELRLSLSALPDDVQVQFRNLNPEQLNMLNELAKDRTFLATLLRDARNTETPFEFETWVNEHVEETGEGENKTYTFIQKEYVEANDGRTEAPTGQQSLVDQVMDKIHTSSELSPGTKARIKAFLSSTNVPLNLLTTLNTQSRIDIVLDAPAEGAEPNYNAVLDALVTKLEDMRGLSQTGEVTQTALGMKYHDSGEAQNDIARFFDSVLTTTPDTLTDLDAQYRRVYGQSLDEMLNAQYGAEFDAKHKDLRTKNPEKYAREKNRYVTKHVQDFKTQFPELQEKFKDVYRNLKAQYDDFDNVIKELERKDPEQFNRLKAKYYQDGTWNKDLLYRDILTEVTGSDATVDRSRRTGFLGLGKSYGEETEHYARMHFFGDGNNGEIKTSTLKALGFAQDSQIDWGKVAKDAALGSVLGLASMATFGISSQATTLISEWTNTSTTVRFTKTDTLRDAIYENGILWSPEERIEGTYQQDGPASVTTEHGSSDPQRSKSTDYGRAAAGVGAVAVLGALHSIVNQLKNNNEVDITNGWNSGFNSNEIKTAVNNAVAEYQANNPGVTLTAADKKEIMADALCKTIFGDGHSVKNYAQKYDLMATITKFYITEDEQGNLKFDGDAMQADCFSNSSNKLFSPDEAQALIAQLMQRGPSRPTKVRVPLQPEVVNQIIYDINESGLVNAQQGQTVIPESVQSYTQVYSDAWAKDDGVLTRNGQPIDINAIRTAQSNTRGNITAQAVVSSSTSGQRIVVTPRVDATTGMLDFEKPQKVVIKDVTNDGYIHIFTYEFKTDANGETMYKLTGPVWEIPIENYNQDVERINGDNFDFNTYQHAVDIRKLKPGTRDYYDEEYRLEIVKNPETNMRPIELDDGRIINTTVRNYKYAFPQDRNTYAGYDISSIDYGRYSEYGRSRRRGR